MAVFGIPDALEDVGLRACKAAMAIQALFTASGDDIEKRFGVRPIMRVGVSSGSVVMAAVDGGTTMPLPEMIEVLKRLKSSVIIPMHWFSGFSLDRFLVDIRDEFPVERDGISELTVSLRTLPDRPTVVVLEPQYLIELE